MLSRIGRLPVAVPDGVSVEIDGSCVNISGPKGSLSNVFSGDILISLEGNNIVAQRKDDSKRKDFRKWKDFEIQVFQQV